MVRRFIDDIIFIYEDKIVEIIETLKSSFKEYNLSLTSTTISIENTITTLPFLDVEHVLTRENEDCFSTLEI